jgi:cytidine deaminase
MTDLIQEAIAARENAVAPWSKFAVGAALQAADGSVWRGCNVENASLGLTVCAERVALLSAIASGQRKFDAVAVVTDGAAPAPPCGPCRQLLWEYCGDIDVILSNLDGNRRRFKLSELFPFPFDLQPEA